MGLGAAQNAFQWLGTRLAARESQPLPSGMLLD